MIKSLAFLALLVFAACASPVREDTAWRGEDIVGKELVRVHESAIERYRFDAAGRAAATIGKKDEYVTGPVVSWKIKDGLLVIFDKNGTQRRLTLLKRNVNEVVTQDSDGTQITWRLVPLVPKNARAQPVPVLNPPP